MGIEAYWYDGTSIGKFSDYTPQRETILCQQLKHETKTCKNNYTSK